MNEPMTPTTICEALSVANDLSDETLAPLMEYRTAKRRTGCPDDLESLIVETGRMCRRIARELEEYLERAHGEAATALAEMRAPNPPPGYSGGTKFDRHFSYLNGDHAVRLTRALRVEREHFDGLLRMWAAVADRIQATPE